METKIRRLIERHSEQAYSIARRLCGNDADAGDIVQEAFLRAIRYIGSYDFSQPFEGWLSRIIRNVYLSGLEREARRRQVPLSAGDEEDAASLEAVLADPAPGPDAALQSRAEADRVQAALDLLSPALRMPVILVDLEGMPREDCARSLGCSLTALDVRLHRARAQLRKILHPEPWT